MRTDWNIDLSGRNTFRMKVSCRCFVEYGSADELRDVLGDPSYPRPLFPIGGGSNLLFTGDFPGTILHCTAKGIRRLGPDRVYADAGVLWDDFCAWCAKEGLWGPENLSYIPGEVGAAAVQNIGAYGREVGEIIESVECVDSKDCSFVSIPASECAYGYRESRFKNEWKGRYIVTGVTFRLSEEPSPVLDYGHVREALEQRYGADALANLTSGMIRKTITAIRREKLPDVEVMGSAGSFFRNPVVSRERYEAVVEVAEKESLGPVPHYEAGESKVKIPAAWLIDRCGLKGKRLGGAGVYEKQPLVIVNRSGDASPQDVMALDCEVRAAVLSKFAIPLEKEVEFV